MTRTSLPLLVTALLALPAWGQLGPSVAKSVEATVNVVNDSPYLMIVTSYYFDRPVWLRPGESARVGCGIWVDVRLSPVVWPTTQPTTRPAKGDLDGDGDVDAVDFGIFQECFNGPNRPSKCKE